jgi:hypothetical protein
MSQVPLAADIKPLFRAIDISHMEKYGIRLDDYTYISNQKNANSVPTSLSPHDGEPPYHAARGAHWTADQLSLFPQWQKDG